MNWLKNSLNTRMNKYLDKYNNKKFHPYKPHVVSLHSKQISKFLNKKMSIEDKQEHIEKYYQNVSTVIKKCYNHFDPTLIYVINDEIHFVFYFNDDGNFKYNGNIMKMTSCITSFVSIEFTKLFIKEQNDIEFYFTSKVVEFDQDDEVLNYIIWRQLSGKNNNFQNFYKSVYPDKDMTGMTLEQIDNELMNSHMVLTSFSNIYGLITKRTSEGGFYITSFDFSSDFSNVFSTFFEKKILCTM